MTRKYIPRALIEFGWAGKKAAVTGATGAGTLRIPKLRAGSYFPEDLLVRYSRVDRAVVAAVSEMVANGVSTREVDKVASAMGVDRMSASQASRVSGSTPPTSSAATTGT